MNGQQNHSITPAQLCLQLSALRSAELLDVRTPPEFINAHVPGARLFPLDDFNAADFLASHQPGTPVYVLCQGGTRAKKAIEKLERCGCFDGVLVVGGTQAWIDAGLPVDRGASHVIPLMRQVQIVVGSLSIIFALLALVVSRWFAFILFLLGCGLTFAGLTGACGMALLLARMPWNRAQAFKLCETKERP